ncbi:MAG: transcription termination/antitermination protein NusG [Candidatus Cloacimonas sp.]|jgi:transcriptional antiterminator NusG|nr:transcription termination/antitermination protein NusG [Candidatus Cloacimonadota bacterium]
MKWYALHVYSGREFSIKEAILKGIEGTELDGLVGEILIPTQKTFHIREGKKVEREKKIFNSYIIIEANLTPELMGYIRGLPGVTHFLGSARRAAPLSESEVKRLLGITDREESDVKEYEFISGDMVKIVFGPFSDFEGIVDKVNFDTKKLTVNVAVFGRVTPVELNMDQVERIKKL